MAHVKHIEHSNLQSLIPPSWETYVRELNTSESRAAGLALSQSFATDPLSLYLMALDDESAATLSPEKTWKRHVKLMQCSYASYRFRGIATAIGPDYDAVALWMPPGTANDDFLSTFWSGTWRLRFQLPPESRRRLFDEVFPALHDTKAAVMGDRNNDCYYLGYIGTKAHSRGKGYASRLLKHMMDRADDENRAMYLESSNEVNNAFYAKFGFEMKTEIVLRRGPAPIRLYCMVREPQHDKASSCDGSSNDKESF